MKAEGTGKDVMNGSLGVGRGERWGDIGVLKGPLPQTPEYPLPFVGFIDPFRAIYDSYVNTLLAITCIPTTKHFEHRTRKKSVDITWILHTCYGCNRIATVEEPGNLTQDGQFPLTSQPSSHRHPIFTTSFRLSSRFSLSKGNHSRPTMKRAERADLELFCDTLAPTASNPKATQSTRVFNSTVPATSTNKQLTVQRIKQHGPQG